MTTRQTSNHLRFQALVDLALDNQDPSKALHDLFSNSEHLTPDSQQQLISALFQEESNAFEGLVLADYRRHRLASCIAADAEVFHFFHRSSLTQQQQHDWIKLLARELHTIASKEHWETLDQSVALHATKGLTFFCSQASLIEPLGYDHSVLSGTLRILLERTTSPFTADMPLADIELAASLCQLANLFSSPQIDADIISLEPKVRRIVLQLLSNDRGVEYEDASDYGQSTKTRGDFARFKLETFAAWSHLHSATVYVLTKQAHLEAHADHFLQILEQTACDSIFWPNVLQALAICSPETLGAYLPTLIEKTIEDDDALASLFYILALDPSRTPSRYHEQSLNFDPLILVAECLKTFDANVRDDFFEHADEVIADDKYRLYEIDRPEELLQRLRSAVETDFL